MVKRNKIIKSILYKDLADKPVLSDELKSRIFDYSLDDVEWVDEKFQLNAKILGICVIDFLIYCKI